jgi:hypothetical protein
MTAGDPELAAAAGYLLRARALAIEGTGDKDLTARALEDAKAFEPGSPSRP